MNLNDNPRGGTFCLSDAGIIIDASAKADAELVDALTIVINGRFYATAHADGDIQLDGNTVSAGKTALFLVCASAAATPIITVVKSDEVDNDAFANGDVAIDWPQPTANTCPVGALKIVNDSASVFTGGTTLLDASDITTTAYDLFSVPAEPLTAEND